MGNIGEDRQRIQFDCIGLERATRGRFLLGFGLSLALAGGRRRRRGVRALRAVQRAVRGAGAPARRLSRRDRVDRGPAGGRRGPAAGGRPGGRRSPSR